MFIGTLQSAFILRNHLTYRILRRTSVAGITPTIVALRTILGLDVVGLDSSNLRVVSITHYGKTSKNLYNRHHRRYVYAIRISWRNQVRLQPGIVWTGVHYVLDVVKTILQYSPSNSVTEL